MATITGSPLWGRSVDWVVTQYENRGWIHSGGDRVETPYGLGPEVHGFSMPEKSRSFVFIPSYGDILGEGCLTEETVRKCCWVLWQAGVKVVLIGGNSGVCDPLGEKGVRPGDVVFPWSFKTDAHHRGLPRTPFAAVWPAHDLMLEEPFSPNLSKFFRKILEPRVGSDGFERIFGPEEVRAALIHYGGMTFETDFDILQWQVMTRQMSELEPDKPRIITLHGDAFNPILLRFLGIDVVYYHLVCNYVQGSACQTAEGIHETIERYYMASYPETVFAAEAEFFETVEMPEDGCSEAQSYLKRNPAVFAEACSGRR
ncbi:MAG: hypothetical protein AAF065_08180 [Verrucomicrobiota bacterium]